MDFRHNRLRVVTYNYDSSLERYLTSRVLAYYPDINAQGETAARSLVDGVVQVIHLHGALGSDADVIHVAPDRSQFGRVDLLQRIAKGIHTVHESEAEALYTQAKQWVFQAESLHILGFGFHNLNVQRLALKELRDNGAKWRSFGATALGLATTERSRKESLLGLGGGRLHDADCLQYLKSKVSLD